MDENDRMKKQHVKLSETDRTYLNTLLRKGTLPVRTHRRALALLELDRGQTYTAVAASLQVSNITLASWSKKYWAEGLRMLQDKPRSGRPVEIDGAQRAKVTALACSEPPEGYGQWSLRLLAEKAVELEYVEHLSHTQAAKILKKTS